MELGFNEAERLMAERYAIVLPSIAFRGRLQHLQRGGFPTGVNTGKGRKAAYGWEQLIQLGVALDLIDVGLTPEKAKTLVMDSRDRINLAAGSVGLRLSAERLEKAVREQQCPFSASVFLVTSAHALFALSADEAAPRQLLDPMSGEGFIKLLKRLNPFAVSGTYIDLGSRLVLMMSQLQAITGRELRAIVVDYKEWSEKNVVDS